MGNEYHNIYDNKNFASLINENGVVNSDICIKPSKTETKFDKIENVTKINGNLYIDSDELMNLGSIKFISGNLSISKGINFKSLENLQIIDGNAILRYSSIESLGNIEYVGGKLSLRDTPIKDLGKLKFIGQDLYLPQRIKGVSTKKIEVKGNIRYWNDKGSSSITKLNESKSWGVNNNLFFSEIHEYELKNKKRFLSGEFLIKKCFTPAELNTYISENFVEFHEFIDKKLDILYNGKYSFFEAIFNEKKTINSLNNEFPKIKIDKRKSIDYGQNNKLANEIIKANMTNPPFNKYLNIINEFKVDYEYYGYTSKYILKYKSHKLALSEFTGLNKNSFIYFIENSLLEIFSVFILGNQNEFRFSKGLPMIGEGWISETELFQNLKKHFNKLTVKQHASPKWLGRQHIDIWFPKFNIGIEFQGKQHFEPIEYFGGEEAFKKNQERDERKKKLFKENNSILIEVTHGYDLKKIIIEIEHISTTANK